MRCSWRFAERCTALCTGILRAALENVHIILSPFGMAGASGLCRDQYRLEPFRTAAVMDRFMKELTTSFSAAPI